MNLLAIMQERINTKLTKAGASVDDGTDCEPVGEDDTSEIEATGTVIELVSCTTGHDADDAFSEPVLIMARNSPPPAIKNEYVMPESNQPPNDWILGTAEATGEATQPLFTNQAWRSAGRSAEDDCRTTGISYGFTGSSGFAGSSS